MPKSVTNCLYCGKPMHDGQAFCYKCGRAPSQGVVVREDPTRRRPKPDAEPEVREDATTHVGFCAYCGKELYRGQAFCPKCGRDGSLAVEERPVGSGELYPQIRDLRDRTTRWGWIAVVGGIAAVIVGLIAWYGLWVIPRRTPDEVRPAIVDQPMVQIAPEDRVQPEVPTAPTGPVTSPDDAIERVCWVPEVELWLNTMEGSGARVRLAVADEDDNTYTVQVYEDVGSGDESHTATMGWWLVEKSSGRVTQETGGTTESPELAADRETVEQLSRAATDVRADYLDATLAGDWAFVDIAEKDDQGGWSTATAVMLRKTAAGWLVVAEGDPMDWTMQRTQMPAEAQQAFDTWHIGHF